MGSCNTPKVEINGIINARTAILYYIMQELFKTRAHMGNIHICRRPQLLWSRIIMFDRAQQGKVVTKGITAGKQTALYVSIPNDFKCIILLLISG